MPPRGMICGSIQTNLNMLKSRSLDEIIIGHCKFYHGVRYALLIALTLPSTTCKVQGSFSTLRHVKTWLRKTSGKDRAIGLYMISLHKNKIKENMQEITKS